MPCLRILLAILKPALLVGPSPSLPAKSSAKAKPRGASSHGNSNSSGRTKPQQSASTSAAAATTTNGQASPLSSSQNACNAVARVIQAVQRTLLYWNQETSDLPECWRGDEVLTIPCVCMVKSFRPIRIFIDQSSDDAGSLQAQERLRTSVSIREFQQKRAGLSTYLDRCSDAAAAATKMQEAKADRPTQLAIR